MSIEAHGVDHVDLAALPPARQAFEIDHCVASLRAHLGEPVIAFAYPSGAFDAATMRIVEDSGMTFGFTTDPARRLWINSAVRSLAHPHQTRLGAGAVRAVVGLALTQIPALRRKSASATTVQVVAVSGSSQTRIPANEAPSICAPPSVSHAIARLEPFSSYQHMMAPSNRT